MELTDTEKEDLRVILTSIYGYQTVSHWQMNEEVLAATAEMLQAVQQCSSAMSYVPRPGIVGKGYFRRQLRDMARRTRSQGRDYAICNSAAALKWRMVIEIAAQ